ncbi:MAG: glycogen synthase GlgA [candidate division NC10 bacterium]|nr:glycogen synthase GlgA [candidate division NC10 bacterium]
MAQKLKILIASPEVAPFAKTGGLADVTGSLPKALERLGHEVRVILPRYAMVERGGFPQRKVLDRVSLLISDRWVDSAVFETQLGEAIPVYLLANEAYYDRPELYRTPQGDYPDNAERFIYFSKAVPEVAKRLNFRPDCIHCNDWQTGLVPLFLHALYGADPFFARTGTLFTIHNLAYQGIFWHYDWHLLGIGWEYFTPEGIEFYNHINLLKAGIVFAQVINTVSKTYSREIQTPEFGYGLEGVLKARSKDLFGIVNGVDYGEWSPSHDPWIAAPYDERNLAGKLTCKLDLLKELGLPPRPRTPVLGAISRLASQKGFDLLAEIMEELMKRDLLFVLLGTGDQVYLDLFSDIAKRFPDKVGIRLGFDNALAHKIEAGSDMFLMPSRYEPCGLNQLYSLKYGTIPIVRSTGGLADTIRNYNPRTRKGNGFAFQEYSSAQLLDAIDRALALYQDRRQWKQMMREAMREDYSWEVSAQQYLKLYRRAQRKKVAS